MSHQRLGVFVPHLLSTFLFFNFPWWCSHLISFCIYVPLMSCNVSVTCPCQFSRKHRLSTFLISLLDENGLSRLDRWFSPRKAPKFQVVFFQPAMFDWATPQVITVRTPPHLVFVLAEVVFSRFFCDDPGGFKWPTMMILTKQSLKIKKA